MDFLSVLFYALFGRHAVGWVQDRWNRLMCTSQRRMNFLLALAGLFVVLWIVGWLRE